MTIHPNETCVQGDVIAFYDIFAEIQESLRRVNLETPVCVGDQIKRLRSINDFLTFEATQSMLGASVSPSRRLYIFDWHLLLTTD